MSISVIPKAPRLEPMFQRVAVYCRESSKNKAQLESIGAQISSLCEYVVRNPLWKLHGLYVDVHSGSKINGRDQLQRMLADCDSGKIDIVVVRNVSRLARNTVDSLNITRHLKAKGIETIFRDDNLSTMSGDGELMLTLIGAVAQAENESRSLNIRWGIKRAVESGRSVLYRRRCYGYKTDSDGNMEIIGDEAAVVRMIFDNYLKGLGVVAISQHLKELGIQSPSGNQTWCKGTIENMLENEKYYGSVCVYKSFKSDDISRRVIKNRGEHDMYLIVDHHEPIISKEEFAQVQEERKRRGRGEGTCYSKEE